MKHVTPAADWPQSWQYSYPYDQMEIYGGKACLGYSYAYENRKRETLALIRQVARPGDRILDVAAAQGNFTLTLAELGYEVTWNDLRADLADYVKLKHERGTVHYAPGNAFELGQEGAYDLVLIAEVIEHVAHPDQFLAQVARLVKPGGHIVMTTPNGEYLQNRLPKFSDCPDPSQYEAHQFGPDSDAHIFLLHTDELAPIARAAGLDLRSVKLFTNPLTNGFMKTEPILRMLPRVLVSSAESISQAMPGPLKRKLHTAMAVLLRKPAS